MTARIGIILYAVLIGLISFCMYEKPLSQTAIPGIGASVSFGGGTNAPVAGKKKKPKKKKKQEPHTVAVYYFYKEPRCTSCRNIEVYTKEAVEKEFADELKTGRLVWMPVDIMAEGNWHYVEDFKLTSKSVIVADYKGEKPDKDKLIRWKNLDKIWDLLKDKPKFIEYIQAEARLYLPKSASKKDKKKK